MTAEEYDIALQRIRNDFFTLKLSLVMYKVRLEENNETKPKR